MMISITLDLYNHLIEDQKRAHHLQNEVDKIDELHFDECEKLHTEIAVLKRLLIISTIDD